MNYKSINNLVIFNLDEKLLPKKDKYFYKYLLFNNVAYYFAKYISKDKTIIEKEIIRAGKLLDDKFVRTMELIHIVCEEKNIKILLFKTYKYIPEIVDGDIDLIIRKRDFNKFLVALRKKGFICWESEPLKASCEKEGFCKIEPRVHISFHGFKVLNDKDIWQKTDAVIIKNMTFQRTIREIDVLILLLNILYGPNYCKLYLYKILLQTNQTNLMSLVKDKGLKNDIAFLLSWLANEDIIRKRFPVFLDTIQFVKWWFNRVLVNTHFRTTMKFKYLTFFLFSKYGYMFLNRLPFAHEWSIRYE